ncbi:MAG: hypothetical protein MK538_18005 [Planctomycetes bacterium]|nr:hypothetical protein [Planctomycetota bacterium]
MKNMPLSTVITGLLLIAAGFSGFAAANFEPKAATALIPAGVGLLLTICGTIAFRDGARKHAMHAAAMVALLGFLAAMGRLLSLKLKGPIEWKLSTYMTLTMSVLCLALVIMCVRSFIAARRAREA